MPTAVDHALIALMTIIVPILGVLRYPKMVERIRLRGGPARLAVYTTSGTYQWMEVTALLVWWGLAGRAFPDLGFNWTPTWQAWTALGISVALILLYVSQARTVSASAEAREQVRVTLAPIEAILPHDRDERNGFFARAVTAGIAEEIIWRGFLLWYLTQFFAPSIAATIAIAAFAVGHAYQGLTGAAKAGVAGLVCWALYAFSGSLIPAIIVHVAVDVGSGAMAYIAYSQTESDRLEAMPNEKSTEPSLVS